MSRTPNSPDWYDRLPEWGQDLVDQAGHVAIGGIPAAIVGGCLLLALPAPAAGGIGALVGVLTMGIYEAVQNVGDADNDYRDMGLDLSVGCNAALTVGLLIAVFGG